MLSIQDQFENLRLAETRKNSVIRAIANSGYSAVDKADMIAIITEDDEDYRWTLYQNLDTMVRGALQNFIQLQFDHNFAFERKKLAIEEKIDEFMGLIYDDYISFPNDKTFDDVKNLEKVEAMLNGLIVTLSL